MQNLVQDIRYALRQLRKSPGFTVTAVATLALGIGATTAMFSLVEAVLLRPLPFFHPDRLIEVDTLSARPGADANIPTPHSRGATSYPDFFDWRQQNQTLDAIASVGEVNYTLSSAEGGRIIDGARVSSDFFRVLGVHPAFGREFTRDEEQAGNRSVILSHALWVSQFQSSPDVLGQKIRLSDENYTIIGVMPAGFAYPVSKEPPLVYATPARDAEPPNKMTTHRGWHDLAVVARMKPGITPQQAAEDLSAIQRTLAEKYPNSNKSNPAVFVQPEIERLTGSVRAAMVVLFGAVGCMLLIACVNTAALLLTRLHARRSEIAVRSALGATRVQVMRQLLVEALLIAVAGGVGGIALASSVLKFTLAHLPENLIRANSASLNPLVLGFALLLTLVTGLLFGLVPAWRMSKLDPTRALREGSRNVAGSRSHHRLQSFLVIAEFALGLCLLTTAGLLLRSFQKITHVDTGFDPHNVLTFNVGLPEKRYTDEQRTAFFKNALPQLAALPGVRAASAAYPLPLSGGDMTISFNLPAKPFLKRDEPSARLTIVEPSYFEALGIPLRSGRTFTAHDDGAASPAVAIINEVFAQKYFPGQNAVGQMMQPGVAATEDEPPVRDIVGVVANVKRGRLTEEVRPEYFLPFAQAPITTPSFALKADVDPLTLQRSIETVLHRLDPQAPVYQFGTLDSSLSLSIAQQRFQAELMSAFAAIALLLSAVGIYGVLAFSVSQRTMEIGVRMALGARRSDVVEDVLRRGMTLAVKGALIGAILAALSSRYLSSLLFKTQPLDAFTYMAVFVVLLSVAALASLLPARRAASIDPMQALRSE